MHSTYHGGAGCRAIGVRPRVPLPMTARIRITPMRRAALGFGVCLGVGVAFAQGAPELKTRPPRQTPSSGTPTLKVSAQLVIVNVSVSDKDGRPIRHLTPDKFHVSEENGIRRDLVPQTVVSADEHDAPDPADAWPLPVLPPGVYSNIPGAPVADALTVLLLDSQGTNVATQQRLREQVVKFARESPPGIRIAIFRTGPSLELIQGFTSDHDALVAALNRQESMPAIRIATPRPDLQEGAWFETLTQYLARFPGRKNILWFASTFPSQDPFTLNQNVLFGDVNVLSAQMVAADGKTHLPVRDLVVYPIDPVAIQAPPMFNAGNERGGGLGNPYAPRSDRSTALAQTAMDVLAGETGGKAFYNSNDLAGKMAKAVEAGSPTQLKTDGSTRHVSIDVKVPGAHAAYRHEYIAHVATAADALPDPRMVAMERGAPDYTQILFRTRVQALASQPDLADPAVRAGELAGSLKGPLVRYGIDWAADLHGINAPLGADGVRHTNVIVMAIAYDDYANPLNSVANKVEDSLTPEQYAEAMKTGMQYHQMLDLPKGTVFVRLVIEDSAGRVGATEVALKVP